MKEAVIPQEREKQALEQIKTRAEWECLKAKNPNYSLPHVKKVVEHIKALAREEELNVSISEATGWLHGLDWELAEQIMLPHEDVIPKETRDSILEAIELHRLPVLPPVPKETSKLSELLHDAYRMAKMGYLGILGEASALGIEVEPTDDKEEVKQICEGELLSFLKSDPEKLSALIKYCDSVMACYFVKGNREEKVRPLKPVAKRRARNDYIDTAAYRIELLDLQRKKDAYWH